MHTTTTRSVIGQSMLAHEITKVVSAEFGISVRDMMRQSRQKKFWMPRITAMYYCRMFTELSLEELGILFGNRKHTTILRGVRRCRELLDTDDEWTMRLDTVLVALVERSIRGAWGMGIMDRPHGRRRPDPSHRSAAGSGRRPREDSE